jgi:gas vesicle protein
MNERTYYSREAEQRAQQQRTAVALVVMAFGLMLGAVITLLFAPRSGEEMRRVVTGQVGEATSSAFESLRKEFEHLRSDVEERLERVQR